MNAHNDMDGFRGGAGPAYSPKGAEKVITQFIPFGANISGATLDVGQVGALLSGLDGKLASRGLVWQDVSLLIVANAKGSNEQKAQHESDSAVVDGIRVFCDAKGWHPSLIGASVHSAFYKFEDDAQANIDDGMLVIAVVNHVLRRIPVGVEITQHRADRPLAAANALRKGVRAYALRMQSELGLLIPEHTIAQSSMGIVFSSGSGHMDSVEDVDFKECYAVGQELLSAANAMGASLYGGCSTNKSQHHNQCLYFSVEIAGQVHYRSSYRHAAMVALIPHTTPRPHLAHPYSPVAGPPLEIEFDERDHYREGRCFYVRRINGEPVISFLKRYWPGAEEYLDEWIEGHVAIPAHPEAHGVTIASSGSVDDDTVWPNVAIWLERDERGVLLRLVRAVPRGSNHLLMEMAPDPRTALQDNAARLMESLQFTPNSAETSVLAFLCESRKMLLQVHSSNVEADTMLGGAPSNGALIGIYLNGEYSTGTPRSIGYHNYSQIAAMIPAMGTENLPVNVVNALAARGTRLFVCHSSNNKIAANAFISRVEAHVPGAQRWIDENEILAGDILRATIRTAVEQPGVFVIPILTRESVKSDWVKSELRWAVKQEAKQGRQIILPVVIDSGNTVMKKIERAWGKKLYSTLSQRLLIVLRTQESEELEAKAAKLARDIRSRAERDRHAAAARRDATMTSLRPLGS